MNPTALVLLDYFGIAVFAISGALVAAERRLDFVTFIFFAVVTGVGGGTIRDLLIGAPVFWVHTNGTLLICIAAALLVWIGRRRRFAGQALLWFDAARHGRLRDIWRCKSARWRRCALDCILDPSFVDTSWRGELLTKAEALSALPKRTSSTLELSALQPKLIGDAAIMRGIDTQKSAGRIHRLPAFRGRVRLPVRSLAGGFGAGNANRYFALISE